jgi:hypothetical protein
MIPRLRMLAVLFAFKGTIAVIFASWFVYYAIGAMLIAHGIKSLRYVVTMFQSMIPYISTVAHIS